MIIKINEKDYTLRFGFDFIDYCNNNAGLTTQGVNLGISGVKMLAVGIADKSPSSFRTIIKGATVTERQKPSNEEIENYVNSLLDNEEEYEKLYDEVILELGKHLIILREMGISKKDWDNALEQDRLNKQ